MTKIKERHQAQLMKIMEQQKRILDHAILPIDNAIQGTFNHVQIEINELESQHGTKNGRYCRICFSFEIYGFKCRKCEIPMCVRCANQCEDPDCNFAYCHNCKQDQSGFCIECIQDNTNQVNDENDVNNIEDEECIDWNMNQTTWHNDFTQLIENENNKCRKSGIL